MLADRFKVAEVKYISHDKLLLLTYGIHKLRLWNQKMFSNLKMAPNWNVIFNTE